MPISDQDKVKGKSGVVHYVTENIEQDDPEKQQDDSEFEATPLERCVGLRQDIYGEDFETAYNTCKLMFEKPLVKQTFILNDVDGMSEAFVEWEKLHGPGWEWFRKDRDMKKYQHDRAVDDKIEQWKITGKGPRYAKDYFTDTELRKLAEQALADEKYKRDHDHSDKLTVGNLHGKRREELLRENRDMPRGRETVGNLWMKKKEKREGGD